MDFATALSRLWPNGDQKIPGLRAGIIASAPAVFAKYGIKDSLVLAHIMAQISHECGAGHDVVENLNYTAGRLIQVWPKHFDWSNAQVYAGNPQKLANFIYNPPQHTDLGNREGSNDGWTYRGRGATQTTGRAGYRDLGAKIGLDLLSNPDLVNDPRYFLECGVADFIMCGCMPYAKADDIDGVTLKLNGGHVGITERKAWLANWKNAQVPVPKGPIIILPPGQPPPDVPKPVPAPAPAQSFWSVFVSAVLNFIALFKRKP